MLKQDYKNGDILSANDINNITKKINDGDHILSHVFGWFVTNNHSISAASKFVNEEDSEFLFDAGKNFTINASNIQLMSGVNLLCLNDEGVSLQSGYYPLFIHGVATPIENTDAANKIYVDLKLEAKQDKFSNYVQEGDGSSGILHVIPNYLQITKGGTYFSIGIDKITAGSNMVAIGNNNSALYFDNTGAYFSQSLNLPMGAIPIHGIADPTLETDAANKQYVDNTIANAIAALKTELNN